MSEEIIREEGPFSELYISFRIWKGYLNYEVYLNDIYNFSSYLTENTLFLGYKNKVFSDV
jgi:hypothetical protein